MCMYCLHKNLLRFKDTHRLKKKGQKKICHVHGSEKRRGVTIIASNKINLKPKSIKRQKGTMYQDKSQFTKKI
jgi:hypothetical protein